MVSDILFRRTPIALTTFTKYAWPTLIGLLVAQVLFAGLRFLVHDRGGALLVIIVAAVGFFACAHAWSGGINPLYFVYFSTISIISCSWDLAVLLELAIHAMHAPTLSVQFLLLLMSAVTQLLAAVLAYGLWKDSELADDAEDSEIQSLPRSMRSTFYQAISATTLGSRVGGGASASAAATSADGQGPEEAAFCGKSHRIP